MPVDAVAVGIAREEPVAAPDPAGTLAEPVRVEFETGAAIAGNRTESGFAMLGGFDLSADGVTDAQDAVVSELRVWRAPTRTESPIRES